MGIAPSTVTHFNLFHFSSHAAARRADASLRPAKQEWDGAKLRNGDVACNNLLPLVQLAVGEGAEQLPTAVVNAYGEYVSGQAKMLFDRKGL